MFVTERNPPNAAYLQQNPKEKKINLLLNIQPQEQMSHIYRKELT